MATTAMAAAHANRDHDSHLGAPAARAWSAYAEAPRENRPSATGRSQPSGVYRWMLMTL
jgi:hypothetical protein